MLPAIQDSPSACQGWQVEVIDVGRIVSARLCLPGSGGRTVAQTGSLRRNFRWPRKLQRRRRLRRRRARRSSLLATCGPGRTPSLATASTKRSKGFDRFCYLIALMGNGLAFQLIQRVLGGALFGRFLVRSPCRMVRLLPDQGGHLEALRMIGALFVQQPVHRRLPEHFLRVLLQQALVVPAVVNSARQLDF